MSRHIASLGIAALAGLVTTAAAATDLDIINAPEIDVSRSAAAQGWYVRGDLGYAGWTKAGRASVTQSGVSTDFDEGRFSHPVSFGAGLGYQFGDIVRVDLTADFSRDDFEGSAACAGGACTFKADYSTVGLMVNGYADLGTFAGFTPYVGAGLGATYLDWRDAACSGAGCTSASLEGKNDFRFTYALMAGASVDLAPRVKLDVGYRFSDTAGGAAFSAGAMDVRDDGLRKHEFRIGLRIPLW